MLIECTWLLIRWNGDYRGVQKWREKLLDAKLTRSGKTRRHRPKHETYPTLKAYGNFLDNREDYLCSESVLFLVSYKQRSCRLGSFASHAKHDASISHSVIPEKDTDSRFNRSSNQESGLLRRPKQSDC